MRRYQKLRQRKKRRIECGKIVSSASEADELEETSEDSECEATAQRQPGLLLDLSKANILPGPLLSVLEGNPAAKTSSIPFEKALSMKEQLGRNDIWAFSLDGKAAGVSHFYKYLSGVLCVFGPMECEVAAAI